MKIKEIHKYSIKTRKGNKIIETDAKLSELNQLIKEYQNNATNYVLPKLKKIVIHEIGQDKRSLSESEIETRLDGAKNLNNLAYFKGFMHKKGFIFDYSLY